MRLPINQTQEVTIENVHKLLSGSERLVIDASGKMWITADLANMMGRYKKIEGDLDKVLRGRSF